MTSADKVVVIGGGFAGLSAAAKISESCAKVILVEASDQLGGRVRQVHPFQGCPLVDLGGEFIHGRNTEAFTLAKRFGWKIDKIDDDEESETNDKEKQAAFSYTYANGNLLRKDDKNRDILKAQTLVTEFLATGTELRRIDNVHPRFENLTENNFYDRTNEELRSKDISLAAFLSKSGEMDSGAISLADSYYCQSEGNDMDRMGMLECSRAEDCWKYGTGTFRLKQSYHGYLKHLIAKCKDVDIKLHWQAKSIDWNEACLAKVINQNGDILEANHVVIAVPLKILKEGDIDFHPQLPCLKAKAIESMEMRNAVKMFCCFNQRFWPSDMTTLYCGQLTPFQQIWTECVYEKNGEWFYVLCGFATASLASQATNSNKNELKERFLKQLDKIFGQSAKTRPATDSFVDFYYYDWQNHPFIRGGYASPVVGSYEMPIELAKPIGKTLFFAGEAANVSSTSTVQAAIDSGIRAADEILGVMKNETQPTHADMAFYSGTAL